MSMLRELLDELTEQLEPPDEDMVAEAGGTDCAPSGRRRCLSRWSGWTAGLAFQLR
jgi:hypothetical protein